MVCGPRLARRTRVSYELAGHDILRLVEWTDSRLWLTATDRHGGPGLRMAHSIKGGVIPHLWRLSFHAPSQTLDLVDLRMQTWYEATKPRR